MYLQQGRCRSLHEHPMGAVLGQSQEHLIRALQLTLHIPFRTPEQRSPTVLQEHLLAPQTRLAFVTWKRRGLSSPVHRLLWETSGHDYRLYHYFSLEAVGPSPVW